MDRKPGRSIAIVASLQAATALAALAASPAAALAAAAIGVLATGRYASMALFAATMAPGPASRLHAPAALAWFLGFAALVAAVAAVALRLREALPWAVAAAVIGPLGVSVMALASGLGSAAAAGRDAPRAGGAR